MLKLRVSTHSLEAGCDEAGRGCLAGPVVAAAVILPNGFSNALLNDSKKLTKANRDELRQLIEKEAVAFGVGILDNHAIDKENILRASFLAMHQALDKLKPAPKFIAVDGNRFIPYRDIPFECVVKGDGQIATIAAASILAKTHRDEIMEKLHLEYPFYDWHKNKGYPTKAHRAGIQKKGASPYHRKSFTLLPTQTKLNL